MIAAESSLLPYAVKRVPDRCLTSSQRELFLRLVRMGSAPLSEVAEQVEDVRALIEQGYLELKIAAYEWGTDWSLIALDTHPVKGTNDGLAIHSP
jgi:hypothetical protein